MNTNPRITRWITTGMLATIFLTSATAAFADHGRRFKGGRGDFPVQRVVIRERSSSAGPAIAGLIGGFILGSAISSNAHPVVVHEHRHYRRPVVVYRYYDPYDDMWFDSLDDCDFRHHRHPRVIQVIDIRSGRHVRTLRWVDGDWRRMSGDWDERDFDDDED